MNVDELIEKLIEFKKKNPKVAKLDISIYLQMENNDKAICVNLKEVSYCGSSRGSFPILEGSFDWDKDLR